MASADPSLPHPHRASPSDCGPQLRRDPLTATAVFLAPARGARPIEFADTAASGSTDDQQVACPFCRGHENLAPPSVLSLPEGGDWQARIVPNRYPIVGDSRTAVVTGEAMHSPLSGHPQPRPAVGVHEVLIESPEHDTRVEAIASTTWAIAWQAAHRRLQSLADQPDAYRTW